jgi:predicted ATPase
MSSFINAITPNGVLSFGPATGTLSLEPLNILIGPNGSGKSNLIELFELLKATPTDMSAVIRATGGIQEWLWKGNPSAARCSIDINLTLPERSQELRYRLALSAVRERVELIDEVLEEATPRLSSKDDVYFYYRFQHGRPAINVKQEDGEIIKRRLSRDTLDSQQSVLSQRRDPDLYPELTSVGQAFSKIVTYREWTIGRNVPLRTAQPADDQDDTVLPDGRNLGLVLNALQNSDKWTRFNVLLRRFLPRYRVLNTRIQSNSVQVFLQEDGLRTPVPATRLSDGTIRFIALVAILLRPENASLICIEEPELGLHPDAIAIIAELLIDASRTTQLVVTTQSDALISALNSYVQSVVVCENLAGQTAFRRLDNERLREWLKEYRLGELWRIGQLGGNP